MATIFYKKLGLKHAQRQRLLFIDRCFTWRGLARRRDHQPITPSSMLDVFGVLNTASEDGSPASLPRAKRWLDPYVATVLHDAISNQRKVRIAYTSMSSGETAPQWVAPTRFTFDGESIHFRAYSYKRGEYRNFHPARIEPADEYQTDEINEPLPFDAEWHTLSTIWLRPSTWLSPAQAAVVRREYGFSDDLLKVELRQALEFYLDRRWGLNEAGARLERVRTEHCSIDDLSS